MKKLLFISLVLALVLTLVVPSVAMASSPTTFNATGVMTSIDTGNVEQIGSTSLWNVTDRHIEGKFLSGDHGKANKVTGPFTVTYGGVFDITNQAGTFVGKMETKSVVFAVSGKTDPLQIVGTTQVPDGQGGLITVPLCKLTITGNWIGIRGLKADGQFSAWMIFIPDASGHVAAIVSSYFNMTGNYKK